MQRMGWMNGMRSTAILPWRRIQKKGTARSTGSAETGGIMWKPTGGSSLQYSRLKTDVMRRGSRIIRIQECSVPYRISARGRRRNFIISLPGTCRTVIIIGAAWISVPLISIMMCATVRPGRIIMRCFLRIPGPAHPTDLKTGRAFGKKRSVLWTRFTAPPFRRRLWMPLRLIWRSFVLLPACGWRMVPFTDGKAALTMWEAAKGPVPMYGITLMRCLFFSRLWHGAYGIWSSLTASRMTAGWNSVSACLSEAREGDSIPVWTDSWEASC